MVAYLRRTRPDLEVVPGDAAHLAALLAERGVSRADAVICGLPWALFDDATQRAILEQISQVIGTTGAFTTFAYLHGMTLAAARRFRATLRATFDEVVVSAHGVAQRAARVRLRLPPAGRVRADPAGGIRSPPGDRLSAAPAAAGPRRCCGWPRPRCRCSPRSRSTCWSTPPWWAGSAPSRWPGWPWRRCCSRRSPASSRSCPTAPRPAPRGCTAPVAGPTRWPRACRPPGWRSPPGCWCSWSGSWWPARSRGRWARSRTIAAGAEAWLRVALFGAPLVLVTLAGNGWMRGVQDTVRPLWFVLAGNGLSALLCAPLVHGLGGWAGLGLVGSARGQRASASWSVRGAVPRRADPRAGPAAGVAAPAARGAAGPARAGPRPARAQPGLPGLLPVRGRGGHPVRRADRGRAPDRAAAVGVPGAGARRRGHRGPVAGRGGAGRPGRRPRRRGPARWPGR